MVQGNPDGQHQTNFGALAAYEVPFFVIPDRFGTKYAKELPGNNVGAVIWYVLPPLVGIPASFMF